MCVRSCDGVFLLKTPFAQEPRRAVTRLLAPPLAPFPGRARGGSLRHQLPESQGTFLGAQANAESLSSEGVAAFTWRN